MFEIWTAEGTARVTAAQVTQAIHYSVLADRRELLALLRARICLSCAEPRTGTFDGCPLCRNPYPKDP